MAAPASAVTAAKRGNSRCAFVARTALRARSDSSAQRGEDVRIGRQRHVVEEPAEPRPGFVLCLVQHLFEARDRRVGAAAHHRRVRRDQRPAVDEPVRDRRHTAAAVRHDVAHAREPLDGPRHDEIGDGARRLERELEQRRLQPGQRRAVVAARHCRAGGDRRVDERDPGPVVELRVERVEAGRALVHARVVGQQADAVGLEFVERVAKLVDRGRHVGKREGGEEPEPVGPALRAAAAVLVQRPGEARPAVGRYELQRHRDRQHRDVDAVAVHAAQRRLG
jgi:hypothetical protein